MKRLDFTEYSRLLSAGLFADKVILALIKFRQSREIGTEERETFGQARDFLNEVIEGGNFTTGIFRSYSDVSASQAFTQAIDAIVIPLSSKADFIDYIGKLHVTIDKILSNETLDEQELNKVINFFTRYSRKHFQQSSSMLEVV